MIGVAFKGDETIIKSDQHVYQWDTGQKIMVSGLGDSSINQVHFSFNGLKTAYPVNVTNSSGTVTVNIPNIVLRYGKDVYMYLCIKNTNGTVVTIKTVIIPVIKRNMPENYMYDDNETVAVKLDELQTEIQRSTGVDTDHETRITSLEEAKTNADGEAFGTLKERLDNDFNKLNDDLLSFGALSTLPLGNTETLNNYTTFTVNDNKTISVTGVGKAGSNNVHHIFWDQKNSLPDYLQVGKKYVANVKITSSQLHFQIYYYAGTSTPKSLVDITSKNSGIDVIFELPANTTGVMIRLSRFMTDEDINDNVSIYLGSMPTNLNLFEIFNNINVNNTVTYKGSFSELNYTDVNDIVSSGIYHCSNYTDISHLPVQATGTLVVMKAHSNRLIQIYGVNTSKTNTDIYARLKAGSTSTTSDTWYTKWVNMTYNPVTNDNNKKILTWIDDDAMSVTALSSVESVCDTVGCKATLACITSQERFPSNFTARIEKLKELQLKGFHITTHTHTHTNWYRDDGSYAQLTIGEIETNLIQSILYLKSENFLDCDMLVYPGTSHEITGVPNVAKKWCKCGVNSQGGMNVGFTDGLYNIKRTFVDTTHDLDYYKSILDSATDSSEMYWCVLGTHSYMSDYDEDLITQVLNYAKSTGWEIMTLNEAYNYRAKYYDNTL